MSYRDIDTRQRDAELTNRLTKSESRPIITDADLQATFNRLHNELEAERPNHRGEKRNRV